MYIFVNNSTFFKLLFMETILNTFCCRIQSHCPKYNKSKKCALAHALLGTCVLFCSYFPLFFKLLFMGTIFDQKNEFSSKTIQKLAPICEFWSLTINSFLRKVMAIFGPHVKNSDTVPFNVTTIKTEGVICKIFGNDFFFSICPSGS